MWSGVAPRPSSFPWLLNLDGSFIDVKLAIPRKASFLQQLARSGCANLDGVGFAQTGHIEHVPIFECFERRLAVRPASNVRARRHDIYDIVSELGRQSLWRRHGGEARAAPGSMPRTQTQYILL